MRRGIIFFTIIIALSFIVAWVHNKKLKGFPTVFFRQSFVTMGAFIAVVIAKISIKIKAFIVALFIVLEPLRVSISAGFLFVMLFGLKSYNAFRKIGSLIFGHNKLNFPRTPTIFMANYAADIVEYTAIGIFPRKTSWLVHNSIGGFFKPFFGKDRIIPVDVRKKGTFDFIKKSVRNSVSNGYHVFAYPEKSYYTREGIYSLNPFHTGLFKIAKDLGITITPVVIDHLTCEWPKRCNIHILDPITVQDVAQAKKECWQVMERKLHYLRYVR